MRNATRTTTEFRIDRVSCDPVLAVVAGAPVNDVLQEATNTLDAAIGIIYLLVRDAGNSVLWGALNLVELAKGMVSAVVESSDLDAPSESEKRLRTNPNLAEMCDLATRLEICLELLSRETGLTKQADGIVAVAREMAAGLRRSARALEEAS